MINIVIGVMTEIADFYTLISNKINRFHESKDFPQLEQFNITKEELNDYLLDKQAILDREGSKRSQYTIMGLLIALPLIVLSAFPQKSLPWGDYTYLAGVLVGMLLVGLVKVVTKCLVNQQLRRIADVRIEKYLETVQNYNTN